MFLYILYLFSRALFFIVAVSWAEFLVFFFLSFLKSLPPLPTSLLYFGFIRVVIKDCRTAAGLHKIRLLLFARENLTVVVDIVSSSLLCRGNKLLDYKREKKKQERNLS